jgi:hypothetical protein
MQQRWPFNAQFHPHAYANFVLGGNQNSVSAHIHHPALSSGGWSPPKGSVAYPQFQRKTNFGAPFDQKRVKKWTWLTIFYRDRGHWNGSTFLRASSAPISVGPRKTCNFPTFDSLSLGAFGSPAVQVFTLNSLQLCPDPPWSSDDRPSLPDGVGGSITVLLKTRMISRMNRTWRIDCMIFPHTSAAISFFFGMNARGQ